MSERDGRFFVEMAGTVINGHRRGDGELIVLLHGGPGCHDYFHGSVLADWLAEGHAVYSYDQRGCHGSPSTGPFTLAASVADLEAIRQQIGVEQISILGHSAGAILAVHYAAAFPANVSRLILLSPAGIRAGWRPAFDKTIGDRITDQQRASLSEIDNRILRQRDRSARGPLYQERFNIVLPCYVDPRHRDRAPTMEHYSREVNVAAFNTIQSSYDDASWEARLEDYQGRVLIVHGRSDPIPWRVVDDLQDVFPQAEVASLDGCGHFPWLEEPDACREALVAFLRDRG